MLVIFIFYFFVTFFFKLTFNTTKYKKKPRITFVRRFLSIHDGRTRTKRDTADDDNRKCSSLAGATNAPLYIYIRVYVLRYTRRPTSRAVRPVRAACSNRSVVFVVSCIVHTPLEIILLCTVRSAGERRGIRKQRLAAFRRCCRLLSGSFLNKSFLFVLCERFTGRGSVCAPDNSLRKNMDEETALVLGVQLLALCCIACSLVGIFYVMYFYNIHILLILRVRRVNRDFCACACANDLYTSIYIYVCMGGMCGRFNDPFVRMISNQYNLQYLDF